MNPQIREKAEEIVERLKNSCRCTTQLNCTFHTINLADEIASAIALAERRGGERVLRAVEEARVPAYCGCLQGCINAARAALDEMGKGEAPAVDVSRMDHLL